MHGLKTPMKLSKLAIYRPILIKIGTLVKKNMQSPKNTKPEVFSHFSQMAAAAILKFDEMQ
jgi:hypothetical protein